jgi:hypothetical protein
VPRHVIVQTGQHGISPRLAWAKTFATASGLVFNAYIMPGPRNSACDARHNKKFNEGINAAPPPKITPWRS